jgi:hypothetical protein
LGNVDLVGVLWVGGGGKQVVNGTDAADLGSDVDGRGVSVEAEVFVGGGKPDEDSTATPDSSNG